MSKMYIKPFGLDMGNYPDEEILAMQGDTMTRYVRFKLFGAGGAIDLTGCSARFTALKPDGNRIFNDAQIIDHVNGILDVELTSQTLAVAGAVKAEVIVSKGGTRLSSFPFVVRVVKTIQDDNAIVSMSELNALDKTIEEIRKASEVVQHADNILEETGRKYLNQMEQERQEVDNIYQKITNDENVKAMTDVRANEQTRVEAEQERENNEAERKQNEVVRIKQEKARVEKEGLRNTSEEERVKSETARAEAESKRVGAEEQRAKDEVVRLTSEKERADHEATRVQSEEERVSHETARESSEKTRISNEDERIANELARKKAEAERLSHEESRQNGESLRLLNENGRLEAENTRKSNEEARVKEWEQIKDSYKEQNVGDMKKLVYDTDGDGVIDKADDSNKLGGKPADAYALKGEAGEGRPVHFTWNYLADKFTWGNLLGGD